MRRTGHSCRVAVRTDQRTTRDARTGHQQAPVTRDQDPVAQVAEVLRPSHSQHIKHAVRRQLLRPIQEKQSAGRDQAEHTQQRSVYIHIT